ncbi:MAG: lipopolysaccharide heptosyltransferase II [Phycisphaerae bacterium]|nr:lipopolysaccharide heptosyltransferase II [Phycisphaerae bacterium]
MNGAADSPAFRRILVAIPNWVGDVVMATPILRALRAHFREAHLTFLMRPYVAQITDGCELCDDSVHWPGGRGPTAMLGLARQLRRGEYDVALLLTNSFRSALVVRLAGIPRRVGYAREGRGWLLTDRLRPLKWGRMFVPVPMMPYYSRIAESVGCRVTNSALRLGVTPEQEAAGAELMRHYELTPGRYAVVNPGAAFGAAKCWFPERFAEVCDELTRRHDLRPVIVGAPREVPLMRVIAERCRDSVVVCDDPGTTLGSLKVVVRDAAVVVCNDTGPRSYANAFDVPTVTIFGPTNQEWTDTDWAGEIKLQAQVECGPCQLKRCPVDLRCMRLVTTEMVLAAVERLLAARRAPAGSTAVAATNGSGS